MIVWYAKYAEAAPWHIPVLSLSLAIYSASMPPVQGRVRKKEDVGVQATIQ